MYDQMAVSTLTLENTGKVGFNFEGLKGVGGRLEDGLIPGLPIIEPMSGHIRPMDRIEIKVYYFPGVPEQFFKTFEVNFKNFTR